MTPELSKYYLEDQPAKPHIYRDGTFDHLLRLYHGKCAYCEGKPGPCSKLRIDHHRPVHDVDGEKNHVGYFWLKYEYANLLPACEICNSTKRHQFPLCEDGKRIYMPVLNADGWPIPAYCDPFSAILLAERPLLLNPEMDAVKEHIGFNPDGTAIFLTDRGKISIQAYGLNRPDLVLARKSIRDAFIRDIKKLQLHILGDSPNKPFVIAGMRAIFQEMHAGCAPTADYSGFRSLIFDKFDKFILPAIGSPEGKRFVESAFNAYLRQV